MRLLFSLLLLPMMMFGQKNVFDLQHFSIKDGLPDHQTLHIEQDKDGYIWGNSIGTLFRYDGYQFKIFRKRALQVSGLEFVNFVIDDEGLVWYFDFSKPPLAIKILDPTTDKIVALDAFFQQKLPFPSRDITRVYRDKQLGIVVLTRNSGFYIYKNGVFQRLYQHDTPIEYSRVVGAANGDFWFCHQDTLFTIMQNGIRSFEVYTDFILDILKVDNSIYIWYDQFFEDGQGKDLKFSELINYIKKDKPKYEKISGKTIAWLEDKSPQFAYRHPISDKNNGQWIIQKTTVQNKLLAKSSDNQIVFEASMPLNAQNANNDTDIWVDIRELFVDRQNNIWATSDNGLYKISQRTIPFQSHLAGKSIRGMFRMDNQLLVNHGKESILDLETGEEVELDLPLKRLTFFKDQDKLWIGSEYGITYWTDQWAATDWNNINWKTSDFYFQELKGYQNIIPFRPKQSKYLWMGTSNGLTYLDGQTNSIRVFDSGNERLNMATVRFAYENAKGTWLCTNQGLFLIDAHGKVLKEWHYETGFPTNDLYHLHEDKDGVFWLGSADMGLVQFHPETAEYKVFGREQGFLNENIYAVYEDAPDSYRDGFLWLSTDYGLARFNKTTYDVNTYLTEHGLPSNEFNTYSHYQDTMGNLYFGGVNGLVIFHPKDFIKNIAVDIPLHLTAYKVSVNGQDELSDKTATVKTNQQIIFRPRDKYFEVHFALMDFKTNAQRQRLYAYKIAGFDENWRYTTNNFVRINSIPYGRYQLIVKGQVDGTAWSANELKLDIFVTRPFYLQWWFVLLALVSITTGIVLYFRYRTQKLKRDKIQLEQIVKNRTAQIRKDKQTIEQQAEALKEMDKVKTKFFSNITHELRTPLTLILGPTQQLYEESHTVSKQKKLSTILKNARHLLNLINQLLDLSKLENNKIAIKYYYGDILEYIQDIIVGFMPLAQSKHQELLFETNTTIWKTYFDQDKWNKIVFNLLSNAIKYTETRGTVVVQLHQIRTDKQESIHLTVKDNGIGIDGKNLDQIFNRFYQVEDHHVRFQAGAGIGLSLIKELIELQGGTIQVESQLGQGTTFKIKIPIPQQVARLMPFKKHTTPILPVEIDQKLEMLQTIASADAEMTTTKPLSLLIIEDNKDMQAYVQSCLNTTKYKVFTAQDGEEGIEKALETVPDLIISDVMMPKKDGFEVVTTIRENLAISHIPIILLTAKAALDSRLEGLQCGADAYLTKPFSPEELVIRVEKLIELRQLLQQRYQNNQTKADNEATVLYQKEDRFILKLKTYILENLDNEQLSVEQIGQHFYISRTQLYRKTKALTNQTVSQIILHTRLEKAKELINQQEHSISEIAYQTGFSSPSYFSRAFKKQYGKSPSDMAQNR